MAQFHETVFGRRFYDSQLPQLIKAINRLAEAMEKAPCEECDIAEKVEEEKK